MPILWSSRFVTCASSGTPREDTLVEQWNPAIRTYFIIDLGIIRRDSLGIFLHSLREPSLVIKCYSRTCYANRSLLHYAKYINSKRKRRG